ncbi:MAG: ArsR/SmtB family transcription factor [Candidatus Limnocylindria bacterium]
MAVLELPVRERGVCCAPALPLGPEKAGELAAVLKALADPTRLQMTLILRDAKEAVCICDLTGAFDLGQPTIWHHMARLREAGLVDSEKRGIWAYYWLRKDLSPATRALLAALP